MRMKLKGSGESKAQELREPFDYGFGKPRIELSGGECFVDGLEGIVEYSAQKIKVCLGSQLITFYGDGLKISSFTKEGAIVEGNIETMEFSQ